MSKSAKSTVYTPGATGKSNSYAGTVSDTIPAGGYKSLTLASYTACKVDNIILNFKDAGTESGIATGSININLTRDLSNGNNIKVGLLSDELEDAASVVVNNIGMWITSVNDSIEITNNTDTDCIIVIDFIY
jgi:hypothetical protein